jgi:hypothetical protein
MEYPSRAIAIAANQVHAQKIATYLLEKHQINATLAISDEVDSHKRLESFRKGKTDVLVTVAMASVGFDVTDCTHLLYLSQYRSLPYALQAFARVTRVDMKWSLAPKFQRAFIFVPNDPNMQRIVDWMRKEIAEGIRDRLGPTPPPPPPPPPPPLPIPLEAKPTEVWFANIDETIKGDEAADVSTLMRLNPECAATSPTVLALAMRFGREKNRNIVSQVEQAPAERTRKVISDDLEKLSRMLDFRSSQPLGTTNKLLSTMFGPKRARTDMQIEQSISFVKKQLGQLDRHEISA